MKKLISAKSAGNIVLILFGLLVIFHLLILLNLLPSNIVWGGGQVGTSFSNQRTLVIISLIFNVLFAIVVAAKIGYLKAFRFTRTINFLLWLIFAYLLLNTVGNLVSSSSVESLVFTPITLVAALLVLRLAIEK